MKFYIKCKPEPLNIYGKLEARDPDGRQIDRTIRNRRGRWIVDEEQLRNYPEDLEIYIDYQVQGHPDIYRYCSFDYIKNESGLDGMLMLHVRPRIVKDTSGCFKEYICVVDRSGSMSGGPMKNAKEALKLFGMAQL